MKIDIERFKKEFPELRFFIDEPLSGYTFTKTGGPADLLVFPKNELIVQQLVTYCREQKIPWLVLGNASNLIVRNGGIEGMVILLDELNRISCLANQIHVQAGAKLVDVAKFAATHQLSGLEFACGIPGSIGGAIYMNAGAYGGEIKDVFLSAQILLSTGELVTYTNEQMNFSYRHSVLQDEKSIVLSAVFQLKPGNSVEIENRVRELTHLRESKQPLEFPSCGSVFKRPEGHYTGKLIQDAGLQGLMWGGAQISTKHAGFIVNINNATATDYIELIEHIQKEILKKFDVQLETEVRIIGREK